MTVLPELQLEIGKVPKVVVATRAAGVSRLDARVFRQHVGLNGGI
jgi:hypothetical protein